MAVTVAELITGARIHVDDSLDDHFVQDDLTLQMDGTNKRFKLINRYVVDKTTDGAPADPVVITEDFSGTLGTITAFTLDKITGIITFTASPDPNTIAQLSCDHYHVIIPDDKYTSWANDAANFLGETVATAIADLAKHAAEVFMASEAAQKLASKTCWWYNANAGDKSVNKDTIMAKFAQLSTQKHTEAVSAREDLYTRHGKSNAPATVLTNIKGVKRYVPKR